jgi:cytoskeletal protein RodZ
MTSFGENLRREREMRGVALEEIAAATKISVRLLESLEKEAFDRLPGGIFNRGFVRAYARYLGLDEDKFLADYGLVHHDEHDVKPILEADARSARIQLILFAVACVLLIAGIAWGGLHLARRYGPTVLGRLTRSTDTQAVIPSSVPVSAQAGSAPGSSGLPASAETRLPEQVQGLPGASPAPAGQTSAAAPTLTELDLQIDVLGETRVTVTADGVRRIDRVLRPPDSRRVKAKDIIELESSDASAVVLTLNGETLPPLGRPGESRSLTLTQKDLKGNP